jgi:type IV pilus assembly protein PilQ
MKLGMPIMITSSIYNKYIARLLGTLLGGWALMAASLAQAATLQELNYASLPENQMEIRLTFDGQPPEPKGYSIEKPARIALDLPGVSSALSNKHHNLGTGNARSLTVIEARDRTRLIVNQIQLTGYTTDIKDNTLVITLGEQSGAQQAASSSQSGQSATVADSGPDTLESVDFKRGEDGSGRVVVSLSDPTIPVDVREDGGQIVAKFVGASLPEKLHRRLDVTDFATPVNFIDTKSDGKSVLMTVQPTGSWEYLAYQADDQFTINVKPLTRAEESKRRKDAFEYTGEKLSLNFQNIPVRSVLQLIADFTNLNLVASDTVTGNITLRLQNVPWDQALDLILKTKGLDKRKIGNVLLVAPADEIAEREQLELESQKKIAALAPLRTEYIRINYAKAKDLEQLIRAEGSLLTERGSITVDERTNTLIIQDTEKKLDEINEVVSTLDIPVQQVLIEARIVVANNDIADQIGVRWGGLSFQQDRLAEEGRSVLASGRTETLGAYGYDGVLGDGEYEVNQPQDLVVDLGVASSDATRFSLGFISIDSGLLQLELSALESEGHSEIVASPKVLTADQQPAIIASGQQIPYERAAASGATAIEFVDAELRLEATPHITPDNKIIMDIRVNNDARGEDTNAGPAIDTNRLETTVLVGNGETVVLGGIFQHSKIKSMTKTPFLGDLPWIGNLFRRKINNDLKQELLVFITPRLVDDAVASR